MCANCLSTFDVVVSQAVAAAMILKTPVHRRLAEARLVAPIDIAGEHANTVAFLRSLSLDPVAIVGPDVVAVADSWVPQTWNRRRPLRQWSQRWRSAIASSAVTAP